MLLFQHEIWLKNNKASFLSTRLKTQSPPDGGFCVLQASADWPIFMAGKEKPARGGGYNKIENRFAIIILIGGKYYVSG